MVARTKNDVDDVRGWHVQPAALRRGGGHWRSAAQLLSRNHTVRVAWQWSGGATELDVFV